MEDRVRCLAFVSGSEGRKRRDRRGSRPRSGASDVPPNRASSPTLRRPSSSRTDSSSETSVSSSSPGSRLRGTSPGLCVSAGSPRTPPRTEGRAGRRQRLSRLLLVSTISSHSWAPTILHGGRRRRRVPPHTEGRAGRRLRLSRLLLLVSTRDSPRLSRECLERPCKRRRDAAGRVERCAGRTRRRGTAGSRGGSSGRSLACRDHGRGDNYESNHDVDEIPPR